MCFWGSVDWLCKRLHRYSEARQAVSPLDYCVHTYIYTYGSMCVSGQWLSSGFTAGLLCAVPPWLLVCCTPSRLAQGVTCREFSNAGALRWWHGSRRNNLAGHVASGAMKPARSCWSSIGSAGTPHVNLFRNTYMYIYAGSRFQSTYINIHAGSRFESTYMRGSAYITFLSHDFLAEYSCRKLWRMR